MTKIVLTCINTLRNRGVEALLVSIIDGLEAHLPAPDIVLLTRDVEGAQDSLAGRNVEIVPDSAYAPPVDSPALTKFMHRGKRAIRMRLLKRLTPAEQAIAEADLVIASGGDTFSSDYTIMERYLRQFDQVVAKGTPLFFLAHSIGPFKTEAERRSFMDIAPRAHFSVRETISQAYLTEELGIDPARVTLTADPAFLMAVPEDVRAATLAEYGLERGTFASAAISQGIALFKDLNHADHVAAWVAATETMLTRWEKVVLVPHVQLPQAVEDDLSLAREIKAAMGDDPRVVVMERLHSAIEFKAVLGVSAFSIAERTHGAIGAMSSGVPTLSIGYSIKSRGVLMQLVPDPALFDALMVSATEFTPAQAGALVTRAMDNAEAAARSLDQHLPAVKARAGKNYDILRRLLGLSDSHS